MVEVGIKGLLAFTLAALLSSELVLFSPSCSFFSSRISSGVEAKRFKIKVIGFYNNSLPVAYSSKQNECSAKEGKPIIFYYFVNIMLTSWTFICFSTKRKFSLLKRWKNCFTGAIKFFHNYGKQILANGCQWAFSWLKWSYRWFAGDVTTADGRQEVIWP